MIALTSVKLRDMGSRAPTQVLDVVGAILLAKGDEYGLTTPLRMAHFLAQMAHESAGFTRIEENLNYSAKRLTQVWPARFPNIEVAAPYAGNPSKIAERVYGGRMGNLRPGDGWRYRGRGWLMLTGGENYRSASKWSGLPLESNPELAADTDDATVIAMAFWKNRGCNVPADADDIEGVTQRVNGGLVGLDDRRAWLARAKKVLEC